MSKGKSTTAKGTLILYFTTYTFSFVLYTFYFKTENIPAPH